MLFDRGWERRSFLKFAFRSPRSPGRCIICKTSHPWFARDFANFSCCSWRKDFTFSVFFPQCVSITSLIDNYDTTWQQLGMASGHRQYVLQRLSSNTVWIEQWCDIEILVNEPNDFFTSPMKLPLPSPTYPSSWLHETKFFTLSQR